MATVLDIQPNARVQLQVTSKWAGIGFNPVAGTIGTVIRWEEDWILIIWDGQSTALNYRLEDVELV